MGSLFSYGSIHFLVTDNPARISDFGGNPLPSRQASGKLFQGTKFISCAEKHNLLCSLEHEFAFRQIIGAGETFGFRGVYPMSLQTMTGPVAKLPVRICVINS